MGTIPTASQPPPRPGKETVAPLLFPALEELSLGDPGKRAIWGALKEKLELRVEQGRDKYGVMLETFNGRDALQDAWEETADQVFYLYQAWLETTSVAVGQMLETAADLLFELTWIIAERSAEVRSREAALAAGAVS